VTGAKGPQKIKGLLERIADEANIPEPARELLNNLASQLAAIEVRLAALAAKLMAHHKADPRSQLLATVPGVGPITAVSIALKVPDATVFRSGRHFAAWLGITPREHSTAGRQRLGKISRKGMKACAGCWCSAPLPSSSRSSGAAKPTRQAAATRPGFCNCWPRKPKKLVAIALANKMARIIRAMLVSGELYRRPQAA
jgi:transposase